MLCSVVQDALSISDIDEVIRTQLMDQSDQLVMPSIPLLCHHNNTNSPYVRLLEQPASRNLRFRYECEGRSAGSIAGASSTQENKTYPTIQVINYQGPFAVVVSAVTKEGPPYRPHPHNLVGREGCKKGVCTLVVNNPDMTYSFTSLGIQCVKKRDIEKSLQLRQHHKVDPFGMGFAHQTQPGSIDLNVVRLCFQVFIKGPNNAFSQPLPPIVSDPIYDKKAMSDLTITKLSHFSAPVCGGKEVILLCDRVTKEDIQVWFYEKQGSCITWESQAEFQPNDVHKQVAIVFRTPRYYNENIQQPVNVFVELRRPSDKLKGEPRSFQFRPMKRDPEGLARKRLKIEDNYLSRYLHSNVLTGEQGVLPEHQSPIAVPRTMRQPVRQRIKVEPQPGTSGASNDSFPGVTMVGMPPQYTTIQPQDASPLHLTPVHSPGLAMSPSGCSLASSVSPPLVLPSSSMGQGTVSSAIVGQPPGPSPAPQGLLKDSERNSPVQQAPEQAMIEKFDSLDIDIPSNELADFNMNLNLSTSLFDSANNLMETAIPDASVSNTALGQESSMLSEESLNCISKIQNDLVELSKLTEN